MSDGSKKSWGGRRPGSGRKPGGATVRFLLRLTPEIHAALKAAAKHNGISLNSQILETLKNHGSGKSTSA